jgi:hypothetical protein
MVIGVPVGKRLGTELGSALGKSLGMELGTALMVGALLVVGIWLGEALVLGALLELGTALGEELGSKLGTALGNELGSKLGTALGVPVGTTLGSIDVLGLELGKELGSSLGGKITVTQIPWSMAKAWANTPVWMFASIVATADVGSKPVLTAAVIVVRTYRHCWLTLRHCWPVESTPVSSSVSSQEIPVPIVLTISSWIIASCRERWRVPVSDLRNFTVTLRKAIEHDKIKGNQLTG